MVSRRTVSRRILRNPFRIFFGIYMEPHNEVARMSIRCNKYCMYWCTSTCIFYYMKCVNIYIIYIYIWSVELGSIQRLGSILRYWIRLYIPHIFVWGSCFLLCTPVGLPPPPPSLCHTQLFHHNSSIRNSSTHNSFTHNFVTHSFVTHTQLSRAQLSHTQLFQTQLFLKLNCQPSSACQRGSGWAPSLWNQGPHNKLVHSNESRWTLETFNHLLRRR